MMNRFERLTTGVSQIYKGIQKIKKHKMSSIGLKGTHVMCLYHLSQASEGLTAADLCHLCGEDKAGISRILSDLEEEGFLYYEQPAAGKKYRARALLTDSGKTYAQKTTELILHSVSRIGNGITEEERVIFYKVLFQIADNIKEICDEFEPMSENQT